MIAPKMAWLPSPRKCQNVPPYVENLAQSDLPYDARKVWHICQATPPLPFGRKFALDSMECSPLSPRPGHLVIRNLS